MWRSYIYYYTYMYNVHCTCLWTGSAPSHACTLLCIFALIALFFSGNSRKDCAKVTFDQKFPQGANGPGNQVFKNLALLSGYSYWHWFKLWDNLKPMSGFGQFLFTLNIDVHLLQASQGSVPPSRGAALQRLRGSQLCLHCPWALQDCLFFLFLVGCIIGCLFVWLHYFV